MQPARDPAHPPAIVALAAIGDGRPLTIEPTTAPMDDPMETVLDASTRLSAAGYTTDLSALPHGQLRCAACGATVDAASCTVVDLVRFEGESNPDDEAILMALISPCGHQGLFSCAYGQTTSADSTEVLRALPAHPALRQEDHRREHHRD